MKQRRHKIISRVSEDDYRRLERITRAYGFKSVYGLQIYITKCFLKAVDRPNDKSDDVLPEELVRMFPIKMDAGDVCQAVKTLRRKHRCDEGVTPGLFDERQDNIRDEIAEMFSDAMDSGRTMEFPDNLRKRSER